MKQIKLTKGKFAIVDDEDFEWLSQWKWHLSSYGYAKRYFDGKCVYMHTLINLTPKGSLTDHINRNKLDNRKKNLRTADRRINSVNRDIQKNNTSGFKGISFSKKYKRWESYIHVNNRKINLGYYDILKEALLVRKEAEQKYNCL